MKKKEYSGINVQWPISRLITEGKKTIETRTYDVPSHYLNKEILLVETPGKDGKFKARVTALIKVSKTKLYRNKKEFYSDYEKHLVDKKSLWAWKTGKKKWGWYIEVIKVFDSPLPCTKKGIVFRKGIQID